MIPQFLIKKKIKYGDKVTKLSYILRIKALSNSLSRQKLLDKIQSLEVSSVTSQPEGPGFDSQVGRAFLSGVRMLRLRGFPSAALVSPTVNRNYATWSDEDPDLVPRLAAPQMRRGQVQKTNFTVHHVYATN